MWACQVRRYRALSPVLLVVLAPLLWYCAGRATEEWVVWFFFGLSMATAASAAVLGWWYRSGPFGWWASYGGLMAGVWFMIDAAALALAAGGSFDLFLKASEWIAEQLASLSYRVVALDTIVLVGVSTAGAAGLAGLAVIVPLGTKRLSVRVVEVLNGAIELLMGLTLAAGAVFLVYVLVRLIPSPIYAGAVSVSILVLSPLWVTSPAIVGLILRKAWQVLQAEQAGEDSLNGSHSETA